MDDWSQRILAEIPANSYGKVELEYRRGQVHKVARVESLIPPETVEQHNRAFQKAIEGAKPLPEREC